MAEDQIVASKQDLTRAVEAAVAKAVCDAIGEEGKDVVQRLVDLTMQEKVSRFGEPDKTRLERLIETGIGELARRTVDAWIKSNEVEVVNTIEVALAKAAPDLAEALVGPFAEALKTAKIHVRLADR